MSQLAKALLLELKGPGDPGPPKRVNVQFNPHSLRLQYASHSEGGKQPLRQARQYTGTGSTTLSVELVFDTADEGDTDAPVPVLRRTAELQYFITPQKVHGSNDAPPRLSFQWGSLQLDGVMETLSVDLEHFASDGTALRAKASLTLRGQDAELQQNRRGTGSNTAVGSTPAAAANAGAAAPGGLGLSLGLSLSLGGSVGLGASLGLGAGASLSLGLGASVTQALAGESLAQMAARNGLAPEAWRALSAGVSNPLSLPAGREVSLPAPAATTLGMGAAQGVQSGSEPGTAQRLGLQTERGGSALNSALQTGYALAGAGGLGAALTTLKAETASGGAAQARQGFPGVAGATPASAPAADGAQLVFSLRADPRADSFGRGVPLRDRVQIAGDERANLLSGQALVKSGGDRLPPTRSDPAVPAWVALPAAPSTRTATLHARGCRCGCAG